MDGLYSDRQLCIVDVRDTWYKLNRLADSEVLLVTLCYCPLTRCISDAAVV